MKFKLNNLIEFLLFINIINYNNAASSNQQLENHFLKDLGVQRTTFKLNEAENGRLLVTNLERFRGLFVMVRHMLLGQISREIDNLFDDNRKNGKMQPIIPESIPFPCNLTIGARSAEPPTSVHRLRPGDIDIIAAFGDSLSAGNGIISINIMHIANEFRSFVFSGGGHGNWRNTLTLPNILKVYNPNLYGYSTDDSLTVDSQSHFNIAEPMLMSRDLPYQAKVLISRLHLDRRVDMQRHWKVLTIFIGGNDICSDMCHHNNLENFVARHEHDLRRTLSLLRDQVPRLVVNLLPAPNMLTTLYKMQNVPFACEAVHLAGCHCIFNHHNNITYMKRIFKYIKRWQKVEQLMANLPEFQKDDFTVIHHPFTESPALRTLQNGDIDLRYFASDCFHFSQLGQAGMANTLWNSMLQPIGKKQKTLTQAFEHFECPSEERPYIATIGNS